jgi:hypothetical protein
VCREAWSASCRVVRLYLSFRAIQEYTMICTVDATAPNGRTSRWAA